MKRSQMKVYIDKARNLALRILKDGRELRISIAEAHHLLATGQAVQS